MEEQYTSFCLYFVALIHEFRWIPFCEWYLKIVSSISWCFVVLCWQTIQVVLYDMVYKHCSITWLGLMRVFSILSFGFCSVNVLERSLTLGLNETESYVRIMWFVYFFVVCSFCELWFTSLSTLSVWYIPRNKWWLVVWHHSNQYQAANDWAESNRGSLLLYTRQHGRG